LYKNGSSVGSIYSDSGNLRILSETALAFTVAGGSPLAESARITSDGKLLVGTSTARSNFNAGYNSAAIQVEGTGFNSSTISCVRNSNDAGTSAIVLGHSRGSAVNGNTILQNGDPIGAIIFEGADGTNLVRGASIDCFVDGTPGANDMPGRLVFATTADGASSPTERMRIGNSGQTDVYATTATVLGLRTNLTAGTSAMMIGYNNASSTQNGTVVVVIRADGDLENANNSYGAYSDEKLKENIVGAGSQWSDIKSLTVRKFNFKEDTGFSTHTQIGLIAQEVELVSPGLVTESTDRDDDGNDLGTVTKSVNYSVLYMKAVKALQEAMERIETLEAQNAQLDARLTALEGGTN
jgi:hypothetical protein